MSALGDVASGLLKTVAPTIATALGGPLAGMAVGFVAKKLLGKENATADEITKLMTSMKDPAQLQELKNAENDFKLQMEQLGVDVFALEVKDRESARDMTTKSQLMASLQGLIGTLIICGFLYGCWIVFIGNIDVADPNKALLIGTVFGSLATACNQVLSFLFGSTHGSQSKSNDMANALQAAVRK